jgi:hypothetical protein
MTRKASFSFFPIAAVVIALGLPLVAGAENFNLQINKRAPNRPVGRVKLTLELTGAPTPGVTSVAIGGGMPVLMPMSGSTPGTTAASDLFTFGPGPGNSVVIDYMPLSNFAAPSNLCVLAVGKDGSQTVAINYSGPSITAYRLNAYTTASDFICGSAFKRVKSAAMPNPFAATIDLGGVTNKGRHTIDLLLVLDHSGSMSDVAPGAPPASSSKWEILRDSITSLVNRWTILDAPMGGSEWSGDRINMVLFDSSAGNATAPPFKPRANWADVVAALPLTTGATTALGPGINLGNSNWTGVAGPKSDPIMVIMTDGMQNEPPMVTADFKLAPTMGGVPVALTSFGMPMHTIAFGTPATTEVELLDGISQQTAGLARMTADAFGTSDAFADALIESLKGNTISLAHRERGTLSGSVTPFMPIVVDQSVQRVVFSAEWSAPFTNAIEIEVYPPNLPPTSEFPATPTARRDAAHSTVVGFDIGPDFPHGIWQVRLRRRFTTATAGTPPIPFNFSTHFLENRLSYTTSFDAIHQGTGDRFNVRAELGYDGLPLRNLPAGSIRVRIARPGESIGNILHDSVGNIPPGTGPDPTTPYQQKVGDLTDNGNLAGRIAPVDASTISLVETSDGVYTGSFKDTTKAGQYTFDVVLDWDTPQTGRVHRAERLERDVTVKPDAKSTDIQSVDMGGGTWQVTVTPRDRFGNYVGPGHAPFVVATNRGPGTIVTGDPADPNQTGKYVFTINNVPAGSSPQVDVTYGGTPVGGTTGGGGGSSGQWRFFVDAGINDPDAAINGKFSINAGIERMITSNWSVEGILGYHTFDGAFVDPDIWQLSANAKYFFGTTAFRPFVNGGVGIYRVDPPDDTEFGFNAGAGLLYQFNAKWGVEGVFNMHSTDPVDWWTLQAGLRWSF